MKLWLSRESLLRNTLVCGATGTMKTSLLLSWADQAIAQGNPCIFTDVKARKDKASYTSHYYRPEYDYLFNVADKRCVTWRIDREFRNPLMALAIARRLIQARHNTIPYFVENARNILQHAFADLGLTLPELLHALNFPSRPSTGLYARLEHGKYGDLVRDASEVRQGILGSLKYPLDALSLLQTGGPDFSAYDWASPGALRTGHVFLSSSRNNWEAQKDLQALLLDLLFVNIQTFPGPGCMFLDEAGIFKSEELEPALSIQRDSGVPIILAFQNFSQLEENYGVARKWSILSNPETLVVLRMRGRDAVDAQELISAGVEIERPRQSTSIDSNMRESRTYSTDRPTIKLVPASDIQNFRPGEGRLVQPGKITRIQLRYRGAKMNQPGFVERQWSPYIPPTPAPRGPEQLKLVSRYLPHQKVT
jgi:hypothetical protein